MKVENMLEEHKKKRNKITKEIVEIDNYNENESGGKYNENGDNLEKNCFYRFNFPEENLENSKILLNQKKELTNINMKNFFSKKIKKKYITKEEKEYEECTYSPEVNLIYYY